MDLPLLLAGAGFSLVAGANDGSTLIAMNLQSKAFRPISSIAVVAPVIAAGPLVVGTRVATTVAPGLVSFEGRAGTTASVGVTVLGVRTPLDRRAASRPSCQRP